MLVAPGGGRYWRYNNRVGGKQKTLALGTCPDVLLDKAKMRHQAARYLLATGADPSVLRRDANSHCGRYRYHRGMAHHPTPRLIAARLFDAN